jgi:NADH:ubiquinone oxidoreductase subunit F (NADH-binding)
MPDGNADKALTSGSARTLADYQKQGGFQQAKGSGQRAAADTIVNEVRAAGLRGRGGAGVRTADKWQMVRDAVAQRGGPPYLVCNAYDADPKSLIASTLLSTQPFRVVEGIALAAYAIGAREAYLYMRSNNRAGYDAVNVALQQSQDAGYLNDLAITIVGVDVGFMGGEESTMLQVIKGSRAMAQQRPPFPAQVGVNDLPTAVDNIETLCLVADIMRSGAAAFQKTGTKETPGTKLISVYGADGKGQLVEASFGMTVAAILQQAGISVTPATARGVAVGGPEGGVLPSAQWNTPFDYDALKAAGTIVGSATIEVLPADTCMVAWAQARSDYLTRENCGKCIPCRNGTKRVAGTLAGIISDVGTSGDLDLLKEFGDYIPSASLCGFGWNAMHPLNSAMRYYPDDFDKHLKGECPTGTCIPVRSHRFATKGVL